MASVLLSASVERCFVSRMLDFFLYIATVATVARNCPVSMVSQKGIIRAETKMHFVVIKLFETKKENEFQQTKRGLRSTKQL